LFTTEAQRHRDLRKEKSKAKSENTEETEVTEGIFGATGGAVVGRFKPLVSSGSLKLMSRPNFLPESLR
jgi:hypothetical protein